MQKLYGPDGRFNLADPDTQTMVNQGLQDPNKAPQFGVSLPELFALKQALDRISVKTQAPNQTVVDDLKNAAFAAIQTPNAMPPGQMPQQMPPQQMAQAPQGISGLDSGVMENAQFAGGGIIAFADRGEVKGSDWKPQVLAYLEQTDKLLGLPPGTSERQISVESDFDPKIVSKAGAQGLAQFMPKTLKTWQERTGEKLDPFNPMDAAKLHRLQMEENMKATKGNVADALRMYNAGTDRSRWNNPETAAYVPKIMGTGRENQAQYQAEVSPEDIALGGAYAGGIAGAGAALRGAPSSVPRPGVPISSGTGVAPYDPVLANAQKGVMQGGRMLDLAGRAGRLATGPGGLALGLGLHSPEAGAGSDIVPGREAPEGFMAGMQAARASEGIQDILREYDADNKAFYAAEDELRELENARKEELKTAKGKDKFKVNKEYKPLIDAAANKRDRIRDALKQKDEKTGRLPIVERYGDLGAARQDPDSPFVVKPQVSPAVKEAVSSVPGVAEAVSAQQIAGGQEGTPEGRRLAAAKNWTELDRLAGVVAGDQYGADSLEDPYKKAEAEGGDKEAAKPVAVAEDSDTVTKNNVDALKAQMKQAVNDRDIGYLFALAQAGFAMAASKSPYALQAVAEGAGIGVKAAQDITKDYIKRDDLLKRYQREEEKEGAARRRNAKKDAETAAHNKKILELKIREVDEGAKTKTYEALLVGDILRGKITREQALKQLAAYNKSKKGPTIGESVEELRNLNKGSTATSSGATTSGSW